MKRVLKEPLLHFLVAGAALFVLFDGVGGEGRDTAANHIVVTPSDIERFSVLWQRRWMRPPTEAELDGLIEEHVREEILYREALALGLDRDDTIVRRRMAQKMEFLFEDVAEQVPPSEEELAQFLNEHPERFAVPARLTFSHVFLSVDRRGARAAADAEQLLLALKERGPEVDPLAYGDPTLIEPHYERITPREIARLFGSAFADAVAPLAEGRWQGPVESGYGVHLVYVHEREAERMPALEEVRERVTTELVADRQRQAKDAFYAELRKRYQVIVEEPAAGEPGVAMLRAAE